MRPGIAEAGKGGDMLLASEGGFWFGLKNRTSEFGPDSSGGARHSIQESLENQSISLHPCSLAFLLRDTFFFHPVSTSLPPLSCLLTAALYHSVRGEHYVGFPIFLPRSSLFFAVCVWRERCHGAPSLRKEVQHFKTPGSSQDGPSHQSQVTASLGLKVR